MPDFWNDCSHSSGWVVLSYTVGLCFQSILLLGIEFLTDGTSHIVRLLHYLLAYVASVKSAAVLTFVSQWVTGCFGDVFFMLDLSSLTVICLCDTFYLSVYLCFCCCLPLGLTELPGPVDLEFSSNLGMCLTTVFSNILVWLLLRLSYIKSLNMIWHIVMLPPLFVHLLGIPLLLFLYIHQSILGKHVVELSCLDLEDR